MPRVHAFLGVDRTQPFDFAPAKRVIRRLDQQVSRRDPLSDQGAASHQMASRLDRVLPKGSWQFCVKGRFLKSLADGPHQLMQFGRQGAVGLAGRRHGTAAFMAHDQHQGDAQRLNSVFERSDRGTGAGVAGIADNKQIAETGIEQQFNRHPRIGAAQDRGNRMLPLNQVFEPLTGGMGMFGLTIQKTLMAGIELLQVCKSFAKAVCMRVGC